MTSAAVRSTPPSSLEGTLIGGKFRLERVLGEGGMGVVYAAVHLDLRKHVAIKLIRDELVQNHEVVERMLNEARIAASLRSEHVARVLDVGTLESGAPFIVMEYLEGADLATMLDADGPLEPKTAVDYIIQACEAVAEAHAAGIVHRDIKPDNLFICGGADGEPMVKVLDFGVSKVLMAERGAGALTNPSSLIGSPSYMAPESMQNSEQAGPPADVWSLGAVLYELLSGVRPFDGKNLPETCAKVLATEPEPLSLVAPRAPIGLTAIVGRCLSKDPTTRLTVPELAALLSPYGSAESGALVKRIERVSTSVRLKPRSIAPGMRIATPASSATPMDSTPPAITREGREPATTSTRKLQVRVVGGLALGACLVLAGLGFTLVRSSEAELLETARVGVAARTETVVTAVEKKAEGEKKVDEAKGAEHTKAVEAKPGDSKSAEMKPTDAKKTADAAKLDANKSTAPKTNPKPATKPPVGAGAKHPSAKPAAAIPSDAVYPQQDGADAAAPAAPPPDSAPNPETMPATPPAAAPPAPQVPAPDGSPPAE